MAVGWWVLVVVVSELWWVGVQSESSSLWRGRTTASSRNGEISFLWAHSGSWAGRFRGSAVRKKRSVSGCECGPVALWSCRGCGLVITQLASAALELTHPPTHQVFDIDTQSLTQYTIMNKASTTAVLLASAAAYVVAADTTVQATSTGTMPSSASVSPSASHSQSQVQLITTKQEALDALQKVTPPSGVTFVGSAEAIPGPASTTTGDKKKEQWLGGGFGGLGGCWGGVGRLSRAAAAQH